MKPFLILLLWISSFASSAKPSRIFAFLNKRTDIPELPKEKLDKMMEGHIANISKMKKDGRLLAAGPFDGGGGIFIFNSTSVEEVTQWLASDPGIRAERWKVEILPFTFRTGQTCSVKEPYEMTSYQFIRYTSYIAKFNIQDVPEIFGKHDDYLKGIKKTGNVISEGTFGDTDGGILIMKGDLDPTVIEMDPAVREGLLQTDIKKLWIAKGSLCEAK